NLRGCTNATPSRAHFHPSLWLSESHDLLVAQSHNRVDPRGSPRRHIASDCGDHHDYAERYEVHGDVAGVDSKEERLANARQTISGWQPHSNPGKHHPAHFLENQGANICTGCAERQTDTNLARPLDDHV